MFYCVEKNALPVMLAPKDPLSALPVVMRSSPIILSKLIKSETNKLTFCSLPSIFKLKVKEYVEGFTLIAGYNSTGPKSSFARETPRAKHNFSI